MAKQTVTRPSGTTKRKRKGIHSKNNTSSSKNSKNYSKKYRGQGR